MFGLLCPFTYASACRVIVKPESRVDPTPEQATFSAMSTDRALYRIKQRGIEINTVIDIGASNGMWSEICERHFPHSKYLLIEAQKAHEESLKSYVSDHPSSEYVIAAAGDAIGGDQLQR
ncbi:MAG: hypothetical protein WDN29_12905 [Methylovirgula sp.]